MRVVTLNIWNKSGPWPDRLRLIRERIDALKPDLVGLQEVLLLKGDAPATPETHQAMEIAEGNDWQIAYAPASDYGGGLTMGNALLSRHPIVEEAVFELPGAESGETRSLLYALVDTPWGLAPTFVTHLNWKLHHGSVRVRQVRFIVDKIFELCPVDDSRLPPVLMGDFNAEPSSDEIRFMKGHATIEGRSVFFADAWVYGGDGSAGHTFDRRNRFAAISHEPPRRIDYVFVRGPDRRLRGEPLSAHVEFDCAEAAPGGEVWPSDHFGLCVDLAVTPRQP